MISSFLYHSIDWLNIFSLLISTCCVVENSSHSADLLFAIQEISSSAGSMMTGSSESEAWKSFNVGCVGGAAEGVVDVEFSVLVCSGVVDISTNGCAVDTLVENTVDIITLVCLAVIGTVTNGRVIDAEDVVPIIGVVCGAKLIERVCPPDTMIKYRNSFIFIYK